MDYQSAFLSWLGTRELSLLAMVDQNCEEAMKEVLAKETVTGVTNLEGHENLLS